MIGRTDKTGLISDRLYILRYSKVLFAYFLLVKLPNTENGCIGSCEARRSGARRSPEDLDRDAASLPYILSLYLTIL